MSSVRVAALFFAILTFSEWSFGQDDLAREAYEQAIEGLKPFSDQDLASYLRALDSAGAHGRSMAEKLRRSHGTEYKVFWDPAGSSVPARHQPLIPSDPEMARSLVKFPEIIIVSSTAESALEKKIAEAKRLFFDEAFPLWSQQERQFLADSEAARFRRENGSLTLLHEFTHSSLQRALLRDIAENPKRNFDLLLIQQGITLGAEDLAKSKTGVKLSEEEFNRAVLTLSSTFFTEFKAYSETVDFQQKTQPDLRLRHHFKVSNPMDGPQSEREIADHIRSNYLKTDSDFEISDGVLQILMSASKKAKSYAEFYRMLSNPLVEVGEGETSLLDYISLLLRATNREKLAEVSSPPPRNRVIERDRKCVDNPKQGNAGVLAQFLDVKDATKQGPIPSQCYNKPVFPCY